MLNLEPQPPAICPRVASTLILAAVLGASTVFAQSSPLDAPLLPDMGKLPLTAGFNDVEGAGGGGLVPWALITGYGTEDSWGANAHDTEVFVRNFHLRSYGAAVGVFDRAEISVAKDVFSVVGTALSGLTVEQVVYGAKLRLTGDAVYDQDSWGPQTAVGVQFKHNTGISDAPVSDPRQLGADADSGLDVYLSATKIYLAESLLLNLTLRYTKANELGLLGFGGHLKRDRSVEPEATMAYLLTREVAIGAEFRDKPRNLSVDDEHPAWDAFMAWTPSRHFSVVAAFVSLGTILAPLLDTRTQTGAYLSVQVGF